MGRWLSMIISPLFVSLIPYVIVGSKYGFHEFLLILPVLGLIVGIIWAENVRKKNELHEYRVSKLMETPDLIEETWEKENKKREVSE